MRSTLVAALVATTVAFTACKKLDDSATDSDSVSQQVGDAMAAIDDAGGSDGGYAFIARESKVFARLAPEKFSPVSILFPKATAAACSALSTWGTCTNNQLVRTFSNCTLGTATVNGTVTFSFDDGNVNGICTNDSDGDTISRVPSFTITGARGGSYTVSKTATIGQRITRSSAGVFQFSNDGIRRVLTYNGVTLSDLTTTTTSNIGVTGATRAGRIANGGTLRVTNNLRGITCDFTPSAVTWSASCVCATSGSWSATCSTGESATLTITGCGTGTLTQGSATSSVTFDQCS